MRRRYNHQTQSIFSRSASEGHDFSPWNSSKIRSLYFFQIVKEQPTSAFSFHHSAFSVWTYTVGHATLISERRKLTADGWWS
jgi:hypothetical protein